MYRLIVILILFNCKSFAQISYSEANQKTYDALIQKDYNSVIETGVEALKSGHDFYYLHYRMGIAHYYLGNYYDAEPILLNVLSQTPTDTIVLSYMYWNYKMMGNNELANSFALKIPKKTRERMNISKFISVSFNTGFKLNSDINLSKPMLIGNFDLKLSAFKQSTFNFNTSSLSQQTYWGDYNQKQLFIGHTFNLSPKWTFNSNYHFIQFSGNVESSYSETTTADPVNIMTPNGAKTIYSTKVEDKTTFGGLNQATHVFNLSSNYRTQRNTYTFGMNYYRENNWDNLNLNTETQLSSEIKNNQGQTETTTENTFVNDSSYSNSNINLYQLDLKYAHHFEQNSNGYWTQFGVSAPFTLDEFGISLFASGYAKTSPKSWMGINYQYNSNLNAIQQNGKVVNNGIDYLNSQYGLEWKYFFAPKWQFNLNYIKEYKTEYYLNTKYRNTAILGTIKYNF